MPAEGKGPDFWCAFDDDEVKVIGDEPGVHGTKKQKVPLSNALILLGKEQDFPLSD